MAYMCMLYLEDFLCERKAQGKIVTIVLNEVLENSTDPCLTVSLTVLAPEQIHQISLLSLLTSSEAFDQVIVLSTAKEFCHRPPNVKTPNSSGRNYVHAPEDQEMFS